MTGLIELIKKERTKKEHFLNFSLEFDVKLTLNHAGEGNCFDSPSINIFIKVT
jgi:hypothetical protein